MARSQSTLATEFENLTDTTSIVTARTRVANAYRVYMADATSNAQPALSAGLTAGEVAMLAKLNTDGAFVLPGTTVQAATDIVAAIGAFWNAWVAAPATVFATATAITKPTFAGLVVALGADFLANQTLDRSLAQSAAALAASIHPATNGGTATFPGPSVFAIL